MSDTLDAVTLVPTAGTDDASNKLGLHIDELDEMDGKSYAEWGRALAEAARVEDGNVAKDKIAEIEKKLNKARRILPDDDEVVEIIRDVHRILGLPGEILIFPM